ncbi:hypothetical protein POVWA1_006330 [Plasmodium ovale wallikeri]|uniref:Uncharacterized protein n=1 Tax=Plasmodium ovale wallikeri TaxID=864142 RepID=A0A1A8YIW9_PLAOA|nr:hypothetical protein POVWA1_006330 [Plasmodium ovale wallikeri]
MHMRGQVGNSVYACVHVPVRRNQFDLPPRRCETYCVVSKSQKCKNKTSVLHHIIDIYIERENTYAKKKKKKKKKNLYPSLLIRGLTPRDSVGCKCNCENIHVCVYVHYFFDLTN